MTLDIRKNTFFNKTSSMLVSCR